MKWPSEDFAPINVCLWIIAPNQKGTDKTIYQNEELRTHFIEKYNKKFKYKHDGLSVVD